MSEYESEIEELRNRLAAVTSERDELRGELSRVYRLSGEALKRPHKSLTVYELNRALRGTQETPND